jgi:hypothetical protein
MALTDVNFQEGDGQAFVLELPSSAFSGALSDINVEPYGGQEFIIELPVIVGGGGGGNIFIMSE